MPIINFGSNVFSADSEFTAVGVNESGQLVIGAFGAPPKVRLVWITFAAGSAFINADIADADGDTVLQIRENVITINKGNVYRVELQPDNQIPPDRVTVLNQYVSARPLT